MGFSYICMCMELWEHGRDEQTKEAIISHCLKGHRGYHQGGKLQLTFEQYGGSRYSPSAQSKICEQLK